MASLLLVLGHRDFFLYWVQVELTNLSPYEFVGLVTRAVVEEGFLVDAPGEGVIYITGA